MKKSILIVWSVLLLGPVTAMVPAFAAPDKAVGEKVGAEKVGGTYELIRSRPLDGGGYEVVFHAEGRDAEDPGRFSRLVLYTDHLHSGFDVGDRLRLSAEIHKDHGDWAEVSQVLLFLPARDTTVPVWLLSRNVRFGGLHGARYLEMHAPTSDYIVL